jgi:predicted metal-dependent phosphoesterase TrpH
VRVILGNNLIVDFHMHSQCSDGQLAPQELIDLAVQRNCEQIAITDHDTTAAYAKVSNCDLPLRLIAGCEFSTQWRGREIHIVGLNLNLEDSTLLAGLKHQQHQRLQRGTRIGELLARQGFPKALERATELAAGGSLGRPHFARYLLEQGAVANIQQAFKRYLAIGKPAYVRTEWASMQQICDWIAAAGGVTVLAHPLKYKITQTKLRSLLVAFKDAGGSGMEVISGAQQPDQTRRLAALAQQFELYASVGSDFHQPGQPWAALGRVAALPENCAPIWSTW